MNRRIKKKKQKLAAMHASKYKYAKLGKKRAHAVYIQSRHCMWGLIPHKDNYAMYLLRKRRCGKLEAKIEHHFIFSEMLRAVANDRKKVKNNTTKLNITVPSLKKKIIKPIPKTDIPVEPIAPSVITDDEITVDESVYEVTNPNVKEKLILKEGNDNG